MARKGTVPYQDRRRHGQVSNHLAIAFATPVVLSGTGFAMRIRPPRPRPPRPIPGGDLPPGWGGVGGAAIGGLIGWGAGKLIGEGIGAETGGNPDAWGDWLGAVFGAAGTFIGWGVGTLAEEAWKRLRDLPNQPSDVR
jgi:hypothetical protein